MDLGSFLTGTESSAEFKTLPTKTPEQNAAINNLLKILQGDIGNYDVTAPGANPTQDAAMQKVLDMLTGTMGTAAGALDQSLQYNPQDINQYFTQTVQDPLLKTFNEQILPEISARAGSNFWGSDRLNQDATVTNDLTKNLAAERTRMSFEADQAARNRMLQALGILPTVTGAAGEFATNNTVDELRRKQMLNERNQLIQLLLGATGQQTLENIGIAKPGTEGALSGILGGIGTGVGMKAGAALF